MNMNTEANERGAHQPERADTWGAPAGAVNAYQCEVCRGVIYTVNVVQGVTPLFVGCRAASWCSGRSVSARYPDPIAPGIVGKLHGPAGFEWYAPDPIELEECSPAMFEHAMSGGLFLRPITSAGLGALEALRPLTKETNR